MGICAECGNVFEARQASARFCRDACRVRWHRRQARQNRAPAEPSARSRDAARDLAYLTGARQAGKITAGQFAAAAVELIATRFVSVHEALIALGELAWQGIEHTTAAAAAREERETV
jgi:hypothetical protein